MVTIEMPKLVTGKGRVQSRVRFMSPSDGQSLGYFIFLLKKVM
jgi:hypothetical protein